MMEWVVLSRSKQNDKSVKFSSGRFSLLQEISLFRDFLAPKGPFWLCGDFHHTRNSPHSQNGSYGSEKSPGREKISLEKITNYSPFCFDDDNIYVRGRSVDNFIRLTSVRIVLSP